MAQSTKVSSGIHTKVSSENFDKDVRSGLIIEPIPLGKIPKKPVQTSVTSRATIVVVLPGTSHEHSAHIEDVEALISWMEILQQYPGVGDLHRHKHSSTDLEISDTAFQQWLKTIKGKFCKSFIIIRIPLLFCTLALLFTNRQQMAGLSQKPL